MPRKPIKYTDEQLKRMGMTRAELQLLITERIFERRARKEMAIKAKRDAHQAGIDERRAARMRATNERRLTYERYQKRRMGVCFLYPSVNAVRELKSIMENAATPEIKVAIAAKLMKWQLEIGTPRKSRYGRNTE